MGNDEISHIATGIPTAEQARAEAIAAGLSAEFPPGEGAAAQKTLIELVGRAVQTASARPQASGQRDWKIEMIPTFIWNLIQVLLVMALGVVVAGGLLWWILSIDQPLMLTFAETIVGLLVLANILSVVNMCWQGAKEKHEAKRQSGN